MKFHLLILIGFLFIFIDIRIVFFDIIPDIIGYGILIHAFSKVPYRYAKIGLGAALFLMVADIFSLFIPLQTVDITAMQFSIWQQLFLLLTSFVSLLMIFCIFSVSKTILNSGDETFPKVYITAFLIGDVLLAFIFFIPGSAMVMLLLITSIGLFILQIGFIVYIWNRKKLEDALTMS